MVLEQVLQLVQIIISVTLSGLVLLQAKGGGLGSLMGGSDGGGIAKTRRGLEKTVYNITVLLAVLFIANAILQLLIQ
jgi:preprotein translocase subunit SecG